MEITTGCVLRARIADKKLAPARWQGWLEEDHDGDLDDDGDRCDAMVLIMQ